MAFGFMCLMVWLFRQAPALVAAGMVVYLLNASTTNSFASKTTTQGLMVVYVVSAAAQMRQLQRQRMAAHADAAAAADRAQAASRFGRNEGFLAPYSMGATQPSSRAAIRT